MKIYWTYSLIDLLPSEIYSHEKRPYRLSNETTHIGGLDRKPFITHCIDIQGHLFVLNYCPGNEIHLALIGGLDPDYKYRNTATREQLKTLGNIARLYLSLGEIIQEGDFANFNLEPWLKAINK